MEYLYVGKIVNTHGIKGELRLLSKFPYKDKVFQKGTTVYIDKKIPEVINTYRRHKNFDMLTFDGYSNINEVLKYKNRGVYVPKEDIKLDAETYFDEDLIGLEVIYQETKKGIISRIERYDNVSFLIVEDNSQRHLLPYHRDLITKVDLPNKKIYIKNIDKLFE